jgi:hypothetical protein
MKQPSADSPNPTPTPVTTDRPNGDRRRFVVAGLAAAPLLVTLAARPASAQTTSGSLGNYGSAT